MRRLCILCFTLMNFFNVCSSNEHDNIYCKDNYEQYLDWWYMYKFPKDVTTRSEKMFAYTTPDTEGRWEIIDKLITDDENMLQYTLSPMYEQAHPNDMAVVVYGGHQPADGAHSSSPNGILMADDTSGLWITHSVPGLSNLSYVKQSTFPDDNLQDGHLIMCLSLNLSTLNNIAIALKLAGSKFTYTNVPNSMLKLLPEWEFSSNNLVLKRDDVVNFEFVIDDTQAVLLARLPGDTVSLYRNFAKTMEVVLDVYSPTENGIDNNQCENKYGVRNIESISLKQKEDIFYVVNKTDHTRFAVSTAAPWQRKGSGPTQYWTCTSNLGMDDDSRSGGILLCLENYDIWMSFSNLKVMEPEC